MLYLFDRKRKAEKYFQAAHTLKQEAGEILATEQASVALYARAYDTYRKIAQGFFFEKAARGKAAYHMYLLAKEGKVALSSVEGCGMILQTSAQRCQNLLIWSKNFGYQDSIPELSDFRHSISGSLESSRDKRSQILRNYT